MTGQLRSDCRELALGGVLSAWPSRQVAYALWLLQSVRKLSWLCQVHQRVSRTGPFPVALNVLLRSQESSMFVCGSRMVGVVGRGSNTPAYKVVM